MVCDHELSREIPMALLEAPRRYRQGGGRKTTAYRCNIIVTQYNNFADPAQNTILPGRLPYGSKRDIVSFIQHQPEAESTPHHPHCWPGRAANGVWT
eukprot:3011965-Rhodomonas_salina.6